MVIVLGSLQLGLIYGILALGVYITFRVMNVPDLTAEGSFTLGAGSVSSVDHRWSSTAGFGGCTACRCSRWLCYRAFAYQTGNSPYPIWNFNHERPLFDQFAGYGQQL